jgi:hypothetical protein
MKDQVWSENSLSINHAATRCIPIPSDGTTSSHNIKEDGNAIRTNGEYDLF